MSKVKKLLALVLVAIFAISLVACGGNDDDVNNTTKASVTAGDETNVSTKSGESTTTVADDTKTTKSKPDNKTTENPNLQNTTKGEPPTDALIKRTTNRAGNASAKFVNSLKGFTLKILYPWENIYGSKKSQAYIEDSRSRVEKEFGVKIKEQGKFNNYNEGLASELAAKKCENHIYYAQNTNFASYFQKNYLADLTAAMRESGVDFNDPWYISDAKGFLNINGKQYGWIPYEDEFTMPFCIIYNKTLLNRKRLQDPAKLAEQGKWTWSTLQSYAKKFDNDKNVTGFASQNYLELLASIAQQYGTSLTKVSKGSQPNTNITNAKVKSALTELSNWCVGKKAWCNTFLNQTWNYAKNKLTEGKVAMLFGFHDDIKNLSGAKDNSIFGVAPFPNKNASKTYTNVSIPQFVSFIPIAHQKDASKILFIRNEYYRYNHRFSQRNFQFKWRTYLSNDSAIEDASNIKYGRKGNKVVFSWTSICEDSSANVSTSKIVNEVLSGKSTPAQAINSKKKALTNAYAEVWKGYRTTGNV